MSAPLPLAHHPNFPHEPPKVESRRPGLLGASEPCPRPGPRPGARCGERDVINGLYPPVRGAFPLSSSYHPYRRPLRSFYALVASVLNALRVLFEAAPRSFAI